MRCLLQYVLPGLLLIALAFFAGAHPSPIFSLIGFLAFFVVGVTLIVEGLRRRNGSKDKS